nr:hypothetical protein [Tanacetum cinerariifolium]
IPPERRSGISINTISAAGEASSAVAGIDWTPQRKCLRSPDAGNISTLLLHFTCLYQIEERLSDLLRLSNPYLEKCRRTFMMALSSAGIDWPPQRKCPISPAADAGNISTLLLHFTCLYQIEERLSDLLRLSNPYLEKRRRTLMMALSFAGIDWPPQRKCPRSPAADADNISTLLLHFTCLYQIVASIDWPPQRKCPRSRAADAGTTMSQDQGGGGSCVLNMDLLEMKEI